MLSGVYEKDFLSLFKKQFVINPVFRQFPLEIEAGSAPRECLLFC
jgi:hypothetical protein